MERRRVVVEAARVLIRDNGAVPTTREIAGAAGIAEGTLFRAYASKEELLDAVVGAVACPVPLRSGLDGIAAELTLRERLVAGTEILLRRFGDVFATLAPLGRPGAPAHLAHPGCPDPDAGPARLVIEDHMAPLLAPDAHRLRLPAADIIHALRMLAFAGAHGHLARGRLTTAADIVDLVLLGALRADSREGSPC